MVSIEINAVQRARRFEISTDENIRVSELCESVRKFVGDRERGCLISTEHRGVMYEDSRLSDYGIRTAMTVLYISKAD